MAQLQPHSFWAALAGAGPQQYNDLIYRVLRNNGYTGSVQDMLHQIDTLGPESFSDRGRASFGERLDPDTLIFDNFAFTDPVMHAYYNSVNEWVRVNVDEGEVASFDPATTERSELDTLDRAPGSSPTIGTLPNMALSFEMFIPEDHRTPGGSTSFSIAQLVVTGYGPPIQILYHPTDALRLRSWISGSFQHTVIAPTGTFKGRWIPVSIDGIWSRTSAAETHIWFDGVEVYTLTGVENISSASTVDANKIYAKVGTYRTNVDTDPGRGLGDIYFRNLSWS